MKGEIKKIKVDIVLLIAIILGFLFCSYGLNWGRVETWHPDQMALQPVFIEDKLPLQPGWYHKPPFHTYCNFFFAVIPARGLRKLLGLPWDSSYPLVLLFSRLFTTALFLSSLFLIYLITKRMLSVYEARIIALIFATSAGIIAFAHFLTADIPVLFWMLLAFYFCQSILLDPKSSHYLMAGFLTGVATATKYNGLAVGIAIVVSHLLSRKKKSLKVNIINKNIIFGLCMVPLGFIVANPYSIIDYSTFIKDFLYNYRVTPVYFGKTSGNSYLSFILCITEIIGWPSFLVLLLSLILVVCVIVKNKNVNIKKKQIILLLSVFLLYYFKFGAFPRMETRFVLPIMPYLLILTGLFWEKIRSRPILFLFLFIPLITYNCVCSAFVGSRFLADPRMKAQEWVKEHIPNGAKVLSSWYVPNWNKLKGVELHMERLPFISGRSRLFKQRLKTDEFIMKYIDQIENREDKICWYSLDKLNEFNPDFIAINSPYYNRFLYMQEGDLYPSIRSHFENILNEKYSYKIVFDQKNEKFPIWLYPRRIDELENRIVILTRK